jgi:hypothetical protein
MRRRELSRLGAVVAEDVADVRENEVWIRTVFHVQRQEGGRAAP